MIPTDLYLIHQSPDLIIPAIATVIAMATLIFISKIMKGKR